MPARFQRYREKYAQECSSSYVGVKNYPADLDREKTDAKNDAPVWVIQSSIIKFALITSLFGCGCPLTFIFLTTVVGAFQNLLRVIIRYLYLIICLRTGLAYYVQTSGKKIYCT